MQKTDSSTPLVSVVIVNWNGIEDTKTCLKHTQQQTYENLEIIVVDNGSSDGSLDQLRKHKDITLVENPKNLGFTGGHIAGYEASKGEYVLLLNNDAVMDNDYIKSAVEIMQSDEQIGALGGRAYLWDEDNKLFDTMNEFYSYQNINLVTAEGIFARSDEGILQEVNNVSGSCVLVRRSVIDKIGYLHNPFFAYYEESDLFARMKRAGYKVVYQPDLTIWHANAKSAKRKAPTFSYYMMMRNRFRFAVRNFDSWSLIRFFKFYLKMGVASIVKSLLPGVQRPMHQAYAKAFFYNLVLGWRPLLERQQLEKTLGKSNYNAMLIREQTAISVVTFCNSAEELSKCLKLARQLSPMDELLLVTSKSEVEKAFGEFDDKPLNTRVCIDRGYFDTHPENLGVICAKNDWIILADFESSAIENDVSQFSKNLYLVKRSGKKLAFITDSSRTMRDFSQILSGHYSRQVMLSRELFIDVGGLEKNLSLDDAKRELIVYSHVAKSCLSVTSPEVKSALTPHSGHSKEHELHKKLSAKLHQALTEHKGYSFLDKFTTRHYRFAQFRSMWIWVFTPRIPIRLKLGRTKNTVLAISTFNKRRLATEIKHMRNEVYLYHNYRDLVAVKKEEKKRLDELINKPAETPIFIILRDRYEPLKQLLKWLEAQGLKKIVFIDNDSRLPSLMDLLQRTEYQVLELRRNAMQKAPWSEGIIKVLLPNDFYVVTDPDVIPATSENALKHFYEIHKKFPHYLKVGFGLKIDDLPDKYALKNDVIKWESQFWKHKLGEGIYEAGVDTTFAVYKPHTYKYILHPSIRTGEPYTARHLPWYSEGDDLTDEEIFYRLRADRSVNSWNRDNLPERYRKELTKQRH